LGLVFCRKIALYRAETGGWIHGWLDFGGENTDNMNILKLIGTQKPVHQASGTPFFSLVG
jgi:hypothetical protein